MALRQNHHQQNHHQQQNQNQQQQFQPQWHHHGLGNGAIHDATTDLAQQLPHPVPDPEQRKRYVRKRRPAVVVVNNPNPQKSPSPHDAPHILDAANPQTKSDYERTLASRTPERQSPYHFHTADDGPWQVSVLALLGIIGILIVLFINLASEPLSHSHKHGNNNNSNHRQHDHHGNHGPHYRRRRHPRCSSIGSKRKKTDEWSEDEVDPEVVGSGGNNAPLNNNDLQAAAEGGGGKHGGGVIIANDSSPLGHKVGHPLGSGTDGSNPDQHQPPAQQPLYYPGVSSAYYPSQPQQQPAQQHRQRKQITSGNAPSVASSVNAATVSPSIPARTTLVVDSSRPYYHRANSLQAASSSSQTPNPTTTPSPTPKSGANARSAFTFQQQQQIQQTVNNTEGKDLATEGGSGSSSSNASSPSVGLGGATGLEGFARLPNPTLALPPPPLAMASPTMRKKELARAISHDLEAGMAATDGGTASATEGAAARRAADAGAGAPRLIPSPFQSFESLPPDVAAATTAAAAAEALSGSRGAKDEGEEGSSVQRQQQFPSLSSPSLSSPSAQQRTAVAMMMHSSRSPSFDSPGGGGGGQQQQHGLRHRRLPSHTSPKVAAAAGGALAVQPGDYDDAVHSSDAATAAAAAAASAAALAATPVVNNATRGKRKVRLAALAYGGGGMPMGSMSFEESEEDVFSPSDASRGDFAVSPSPVPFLPNIGEDAADAGATAVGGEVVFEGVQLPFIPELDHALSGGGGPVQAQAQQRQLQNDYDDAAAAHGIDIDEFKLLPPHVGAPPSVPIDDLHLIRMESGDVTSGIGGRWQTMDDDESGGGFDFARAPLPQPPAHRSHHPEGGVAGEGGPPPVVQPRQGAYDAYRRQETPLRLGGGGGGDGRGDGGDGHGQASPAAHAMLEQTGRRGERERGEGKAPACEEGAASADEGGNANAIKHKRTNVTTWSDSSSSLTSSAINFEEIRLRSVIGGGGFGQVWQATWRGTPVAVKLLSNSAQTDNVPKSVLEEFVAEINMLSGMRHPNICLYMGACLDPPNRAIITELAAHGSVWDALRQPLDTPYVVADGSTRTAWPASLYDCPAPGPTYPRRPDDGWFDDQSAHSSSRHGGRPVDGGPPFAPSGTWPWCLVKRVASGGVRGMIYLHSGLPPVLHRDLKSANLLLDDSYTTKVADFGLSRIKAQERSMTGNCGTVQWMAPEILANQSYAEPADVYSFGIILWELLTRECPYEGMSPIQCALAVLNNNARPEIPSWCPPALAALIKSCIERKPSDRPTFIQVLAALDAMP